MAKLLRRNLTHPELLGMTFFCYPLGCKGITNARKLAVPGEVPSQYGRFGPLMCCGGVSKVYQRSFHSIADLPHPGSEMRIMLPNQFANNNDSTIVFPRLFAIHYYLPWVSHVCPMGPLYYVQLFAWWQICSDLMASDFMKLQWQIWNDFSLEWSWLLFVVPIHWSGKKSE